jgi:dipeptidyl aminopeptidase/acylaminoacyl peptidase
MHRFVATIFTTMTITTVLAAAPLEKRPLTHDVYDRWEKISGESITNNGSWVAYVIEPQEGDSRLVLLNLRTGATDTIARGTGPKFTEDSRFVAFMIKPVFADMKKAKIAKKKAEELPKDTLGIVTLGADSVVRIPRVKTFKQPEKGAGWIAYQMEKEAAKTDSSKKNTKKDRSADEEAASKDSKDEAGTVMVARRLADAKEFLFPFVSEFTFSKDGHAILFATTGNDSTAAPGVFVFYTASTMIDTLSTGKGKYKLLAWDEDGKQAAYLADRDTSKNKQRFFSLYYWTTGRDSGSVIADTLMKGLEDQWLISENRAPAFSKDGSTLMFGTAPIPMPEDTTLNDEETAKLDVWNWQDEFLPTQQNHNIEQEKKRSYLAVIHLPTKTLVQLGSPRIPSVQIGNEGRSQIALGLADVPYRKLVSWENTPFNDVYLIDVRAGAQTKILEKVKGSPTLSPAASFVAWYDPDKKHWFTLNTATLQRTNVTKTITVPLYNELHDLPDEPGAHGLLGWTEHDSSMLVYDRYDIWSVDPAGVTLPRNLTGGLGRRTKTSYRYIKTDREERFLKPGTTMLLKVFDTTTKSAGYGRMPLSGGSSPQHLMFGPFDFSTPIKAQDDSTFLFIRSNFTTSPDVYTARADLLTPRKLSAINPQQQEYLWGTVELFSWKAADGKPIDGLLYKPENFDSKKRYPMLVYYYERNADYLNSYLAPAPSASTINRSYCVSNGYIVFVPDIRYKIGYPGQSAMDCIIPGVKKLIAAGFADPARIALQGQSWGGYQTAYIITQTGMFRAAMAGAPVSNMTSAYGGIRWESGLSRMFQYEKAQSRIGGTLWEKRDLFIKNSPLFYADKVTTPLLIMANDNDGAVPWYQGIEFFTALRRLGKPAWMLTYNSEAHNLVQRKNRKDLSIRMMQFFDHFLKDAPMPVWMKSGIPAVNKGKTLGLELAK